MSTPSTEMMDLWTVIYIVLLFVNFAGGVFVGLLIGWLI